MAASTTHTPSQRYLSTRGGSYDLSFEEVVMKGLAEDGGLFIPEEIPSLPADWETKWKDLSFQELAFEIMSLYISRSEISADDLKDIIKRSYSTFKSPKTTPLVSLDKKSNLYLLELFHGPSLAFKDVALQCLGNVFETFLVRRNKGKRGAERHHLTIVGATSGDTGSAAIYGIRGRQDISCFILFPKGRVSAVQEAQMTSVLDPNVQCLAVEGTFDDCQDTVKAMFQDPIANSKLHLGAVNSINWCRILAQMTYYFHAYFDLIRDPSYNGQKVRFSVPSGNFGDILAGWFAKRMGLPAEKLIVATNVNDILDRFMKTGRYEKMEAHGREAEGGLPADGVKAHEEGVKESFAPAMDILLSSNFERLLWWLAYDLGSTAGLDRTWTTQQAGQQVVAWMKEMKTKGGFEVSPEILAAAKKEFSSSKVTDEQILETIKEIYQHDNYVLDPHSACGVAAALRSIEQNPPQNTVHIALSTAHPAKFANAVSLALKDEKNFDFAKILPADIAALETKEKKVKVVPKGWEGIRDVVIAQVQEELKGIR